MLAAQLVDQRPEHRGVIVLGSVMHDHRIGQVGEDERRESLQVTVAQQVVGVELGGGHQQVALALLLAGLGVRGPTFSTVSSQHTAYARVIRVRIRWSAASSSAAVRASMPCTNPTDGGTGQ